MKNNVFEIIVGTFVLCCAVFFLVFSLKKSDISAASTYEVYAKFDNADGISIGSDVKISGVKIGSVADQLLDKNSYRAVLKLDINQDIKLPKDSSVKIVSAGLLGSKYLAIEPGAEEDLIKKGDELQFSQSSVNFEDLLARFIFSSGKKDDSKSK